MKRIATLLTALLFSLSALAMSPTAGWAKKRKFSSADIQKLIQQAEQKYRKQRKDRSPKRKALLRKEQSEAKKLTKKKCKKIKVLKKKLSLCVYGDRKGNIVLEIGGKKGGKIPKIFKKLASSTLKKLKGEFNKAKKTFNKVKSDLKKLDKQIEKEAKKIFNKTLERKLKKFAQNLARGMASQMAFLIKKVAMKKMSPAMSKVGSWLKSKLRSNLATSSKSTVQSQARSSSGFSKALKTTGKTALLSAALAVAAESARVTLACWNKGKAAKRRCLVTNIAKAMSNSMYYTIVNMIWFAADGMIIDPLSIALAAQVTAAAAAATGGPGAIIAPLAYAVSSTVLNGLVFAILETTVKPKWDGWYGSWRSRAENAARNMIKGIPDNNLKCFGTKSACQYN